MIYMIGDSNAVSTSPYVLAPWLDTTMCACGWTTELLYKDGIGPASRRGLDKATAICIFHGMNDEVLGEQLAHNVLTVAMDVSKLLNHPPVFIVTPVLR